MKSRMIKVRMLKNERGSQHGGVVEDFEEGKEYEVTEDLAECFMSTESIEMVEENEQVQEETKEDVQEEVQPSKRNKRR